METVPTLNQFGADRKKNKLHGTFRHLQQTSPIINTPTYHSRRSTPEFYKCRGWCQFGSCLGKRSIPLDDLITICRFAILQPYWCSTWHLDQDNIYLTEKEKKHTQQCCFFFTNYTLLNPANPTNSALGSQIKFFHILNQWSSSSNSSNLQKLPPSNPSSPRIPAISRIPRSESQGMCHGLGPAIQSRHL